MISKIKSLMKYKELTSKEKAFIAVRTLLYPIVIIMPYLLLHERTAKCSLPCESIVQTSPSLLFFLITGISCLLLVVFSLLSVANRSRQQRRTFAMLQIIYALAAVLPTLIIYALIRPHSQGSSAGTIAFNRDGSLAYQNTPFWGEGISPSTVVWLTGIYLLLPVLRWYKVLFSRKYIDGVKRDQLFQ